MSEENRRILEYPLRRNKGNWVEENRRGKKRSFEKYEEEDEVKCFWWRVREEEEIRDDVVLGL